MWRSPRLEYAERPQCRPSRRHWGTARTPRSPMTHTPKSSVPTTTLPPSHTAAPRPHQNTNSPNARVRGSRGAEPPGRGRAAAKRRRPCRENAWAVNYCQDYERMPETLRSKSGDKPEKAGVRTLRGVPGGRAPRARKRRRRRAAALTPGEAGMGLDAGSGGEKPGQRKGETGAHDRERRRSPFSSSTGPVPARKSPRFSKKRGLCAARRPGRRGGDAAPSRAYGLSEGSAAHAV